MEVRKNTPLRDGAGEMRPAYSTLRRVMFKLTPASGGEGRRGEQLEATVAWLGECRWFPGASVGMQLRRGGQTFEVISVTPRDGRKRWLDWQLSEVVT